MTAPQSPFRFVPTLTEIVLLDDCESTDRLEQQQLTDRLLERIMPKVEEQLRHTLQSVLQEHLRMLEPRLKQVVESVARHAIASAVSEEFESRY